jgi:hypothetical protein
MASVTGGDLKEVRFNNPDVGSGKFSSKSGETHTLMLDYYRTDDDDTNIDSSGNLLNLKSLKPGAYEFTIVNDERNPNRQELETLVALSGSFTDTTWSFTSVNGIAYTATGNVVGDISLDRSKATISGKVMLTNVKQLA